MDYLALIDQYKEEMIETLSQIVSIKSVNEAPVMTSDKGKLPFGRGVQEAFEFMLKKASDEGFDIDNIDNYGGHIDFGGYLLDEEGDIVGTSNEIMGIVGHLDVVPEGDGWSFDPYSGVVVDGKIYGRGTGDDKGPVIAAFYAMKALKDAGFMPAKKVRLILGLDEETNWEGMDYYFSKVRKPDFGFTPDADFPAIHGEMGIVIFDIAKKFGRTTAKGLELRSITGGNAPNMVADYARAVVRDEKTDSYEHIKELAAEYRKETGYKLNVKGIGKSLEISATGKSAHGARPECGLNAISILMDFLNRLSFINDDAGDFIEFYNKYIGFELDGQSLGCGFEDEPSGKLILNVGQIEMDTKSVKLTINVRYPVTLTDEAVYEGIMPLINKYNLGVIKGKHQLPIYIPADDPFIETLMDVYREHTGDTESKPLVIGGGTYARASSGIVAFGARFPHEEELAHQKDEYIEIDSLIKTAKIYANAIYRLTKPE